MSLFEQSVARFLSGKATFGELRDSLESMAPLKADYIEFVLTAVNNLAASGHLDSKEHQELLNTAISATKRIKKQNMDGEMSDTPIAEDHDDKTVFKPRAQTNSPKPITESPSQSSDQPGAETGTVLSRAIPQSTQLSSVSDFDSVVDNQSDTPNLSSAKMSRASAWPTGGFSDTASSAPTVGSIIKGRFVVEEEIASGGMGIVFKARDLIKEEAQERYPYVALKVLNDSFKQHPESYLALSREARKTQELAHPNIVNVFDFDRDKSTVFMTMELLKGQGLDQAIKARNYTGFPVAEALDYISQMSAALIHAHNKGVLHCDFKPNNVFLTEGNGIKVLDFGIAQANRTIAEEPAVQTRFDAKNLGALTAGYASREVHEGLDPEPSDDVFALACVSYQLLTGQHPYKNKAANTLLEGSEKLPVPSGLNRKQWKALQKGLAIQRRDRTQTVSEFIEGLNPSSQGAVSYKLVALMVVVFSLIGLAFYIPFVINQNRNNSLVSEFLSEDLERIEAAFETLASFQEDDKQTLLNTVQSDMISYFDDMANTITDPAEVELFLPYMQQVRAFWPDSSTLENSENRLAGLKDLEISNFVASFTFGLENNLITSGSGPGNIEDLLSDIEQLDPASPLLTDPRLRIGIQQQAQQEAESGDFDAARALLDFGLQRFPDNIALNDTRDLVIQLESNSRLATTSQSVATIASGRSQDRARLDELIANPELTQAWDIEVIRLRNLLLESRDLTSSEYESINIQVGERYLDQVRSTIDQARFNEASRLIISGRNYAPDLNWNEQEDLVADALAETIRVAEIEGSKYTFQAQVSAMQLALAQGSLRKLIELQLDPDDPFLTGAFVELAERASSLGNLQDALGYLTEGLAYLPDSPELLNLQNDIRLANARQQIRSYFVDQSGSEAAIPQLLLDARELAPEEHSSFITDLSEDISETLTKLDRSTALLWLTSTKELLPELGDSLDRFAEPDTNQRIDTLVGTARNYLTEGAIGVSVENYQLAMAIDPDHLMVRELLIEVSDAVMSEAYELVDDAQYTEAIELLDIGIALQPPNQRTLEQIREDSQARLETPRRRARVNFGF